VGATDQATLATAQQKVAVDHAQLAGARSTLANAQQALAAAQSAASSYGPSASYTMLPAAGEEIRRGQPLYAINGSPTLLLYGAMPAWRRFAAAMSPGRDVAELNANLRALGYGATGGDTFTRSTEQAIRALQRAHGLPATGTLPLGSLAFEPAAMRVTSVTPTLGQALQPGPIMTLSSTKHDVLIQLDASRQSQVKAGDRVLVTLPDSSTTPGVVSSIGKVATTPSSNQGNDASGAGGGGSSTPTVEVDVRLLHPAAVGTLDQAPVNVLITTASVSNALVVPVNALVALAGGGYALEEVATNGTHRLLPVTPGLFDDEAGLVQVTGNGLAAGQRVVVPAST
jgi:peptidoglycan hydrolase-like protein with peptidoglycan-binding domain